MPFRQFIANAINNVAQQAAQNQQSYHQPNSTFQTPQPYAAQPYTYPQQQPIFPPTMSPVPAWDSLIAPSNEATPFFTRLLDAIFTYFTNSPPANPAGFDPIKYASAFTALMYADGDNKVRRYFIFASQNGFPSPENFVYDIMPIYYRTNHIQYTMQGILPVLTREGFHTTMVRDTLGDPDVQWRRLNAFLAAHGTRLMDPLTGLPFPSLVIPRAALPAGMDQGTWERQEQMNRAFNKELAEYLAELKRMAGWEHDMTMGAM
jgi:hypothetical protein